MTLQEDLKLIKPLAVPGHETVLNICLTASCLKKKADHFLNHWELTDVQFNVLMLLQHQSPPDYGLTQTRISEMMLVNRANITSLIDRMEKSGLVQRTHLPGDRRCKRVVLSEKGFALLKQIEPLYAQEVERIMATLTQKEQVRLIKDLEHIRRCL